MKIFLASSFNKVAEKFIQTFQLIPKDNKVVFIANASDPYSEKPWIKRDQDQLMNFGFAVEELDLKETQGEKLLDKLKYYDIIFIAGGKTSYLFQIAQQSGLMDVIKQLDPNKFIYVGSSAGSILAGPSVEPFYKTDQQEVTDMGYEVKLTDFDGLNLVDFIMLPHYNEPDHKEEFETEVIPPFKDRYKFLPQTDDQAVAIIDNERIQI